MNDTQFATTGPPRESVASYLQRLGTPPDDIWQQWTAEARMLLPELGDDSFNPEAPIWSDLHVNENGRLFLRQDPAGSGLGLSGLPSATADAETRDAETTGAGKIGGPNDDGVEVAIDGDTNAIELELKHHSDSEIETNAADARHDEPVSSDEETKTGSMWKWALGFAAVGLTAMLGWGFWPSGEMMTATDSAGASPPTPGLENGAMTAAAAPRLASDMAEEELAVEGLDMTLETAIAEVPDYESADVGALASGLMLDAFLPADMLAANDSAEAFRGVPGETASVVSSDQSLQALMASDETDNSSSPNVAPPNLEASTTPGVSNQADSPSPSSPPPSGNALAGGLGDVAPSDVFAPGADNEMASDEDADEQTTVARQQIESQTVAVSLPPQPARNENALPDPITLIGRATLNPETSPSTLNLQFPQSNADDSSWAQFRAGDQPGEWTLIETKSSSQIASVYVSEDSPNEMQFAWLDGARDLPKLIASKLGGLENGKITTDQGDTVYLRPRLDADPIKIGLSKRDQKLKWNLQSPIVAAVTQLSLEWNVPKDVEWQWIEPIDGASPRNTRGVAMLKLKTSEETAIVVRLDVRTNQSLSLRMRYGARLDPAMPWQWTDAASIRTSFNAVTAQLEAADRQLLALDVAISRAERMRARRQEYLLDEQRDRIDAAVKGWTIVAKRLADLDQLVAFLDAGATLRPRLTVSWPDGEQVLLGVAKEQ